MGPIDFDINKRDLVALKMYGLCHYQMAMRAVVMQHVKQRPVQFERGFLPPTILD